MALAPRRDAKYRMLQSEETAEAFGHLAVNHLQPDERRAYAIGLDYIAVGDEYAKPVSLLGRINDGEGGLVENLLVVGDAAASLNAVAFEHVVDGLLRPKGNGLQNLA